MAAPTFGVVSNQASLVALYRPVKLVASPGRCSCTRRTRSFVTPTSGVPLRPLASM
jgi:hypothetical protein